jgi:hypothetical protein
MIVDGYGFGDEGKIGDQSVDGGLDEGFRDRVFANRNVNGRNLHVPIDVSTAKS